MLIMRGPPEPASRDLISRLEDVASQSEAAIAARIEKYRALGIKQEVVETWQSVHEEEDSAKTLREVRTCGRTCSRSAFSCACACARAFEHVSMRVANVAYSHHYP